jgi:hypothetical protein
LNFVEPPLVGEPSCEIAFHGLVMASWGIPRLGLFCSIDPVGSVTAHLGFAMRIVDPVKGIDFDKVGLRRWLVDYEIALRRRLEEGQT